MGVLDRVLNLMNVNDDTDFEDEYLDDEYDDFEEVMDERPRKRLLNNKNRSDEYGDSDQQTRTVADQQRAASVQKMAKPKSTKISPIRPRRSGSGMEVCVIRPKSMEDAREITETLLAECTVVLNMEGLDLDVAQRIIDFSSGSCYAIHGNLQKISNYIFIITPESVDVSGDFQEILSGAFDVPSFGTKF